MAKRKKKMNQNIDIPISKYPSVHYQKFFEKFPEIEHLDVKDWTITHVIAYFCKRYREQYNIEYTFKFNNTAPTKSYEVFNIRKLSHMLSTSPNILKDYIDWWFENKIIIKKRRITSMAFMTDANVVNEYKHKKLLINKNISIDRSTTIPPNFIEIIRQFDSNIGTYGELAFAKHCVDNGNGDDKYKNILKSLSENGLDLSSLDRVK